MAWELKGRYVASCTCAGVCSCSTASGPPTNPDGSTNCFGVAYFNTVSGNMDNLRLDGVRWALDVHWPGLISDGNWKVGLVIDPAASAEQAKALEEIVTGQHGGPFEALGGLITEFTGVTRLPISVGANSGAAGNADIQFETLRGADGQPTTIRNASFGFAPEFEIGKTTGRLEVFGQAFQPGYGEAAEYTYSGETNAHVRG
jgi:hypothetical protein